MSFPTWLAVATYNRLDGSYINDNLDCSGNIIVRGPYSLWIDTASSIKLNNAGVVTTISRDELSYLDGVTSAIQTQLTNLQVKTGNTTAITTTNTYTGTHTYDSQMNLSTGRIFDINGTGKIRLNSATSFIELGTSLGILTTGTIYISATEMSYLDGATSNLQTQIGTINTNIGNNATNIGTNTTNIGTLTQILIPQTYNSTYNTSDFTSDIYLNGIGATQVRKIVSDGNTIEFDDTYGFINFLNKIHMYSEFQLDYGGTTYNVGSSLADIISRITGITYDSLNDKTTIDNALEITANITANAQIVTQTNLGHISGLTSNAQTQLTALQNKTLNMTNATAGTTTNYTNTHTFNAAVSISTGRTLSINGTGKILLNGTTSYIEMGTSLGFLTTAGVYINATEMSYLDGATSNIQTQIGSINTSLTDLNLKTSDITYVALPPVTSIANAVSLTGSLKVAQQAWLDGAVKLKSAWVAPVSGELGFTTTANLGAQISTFVNSTAKNIVSFTLPIGVWLMSYNVLLNLVGGVFSSIFIGVTTISNGGASTLVSQISQPNIPYTSEIRFSTSRVINVTTSTTYYLTGFFSFTGTSPAVNTPTYLEATRIA